MYSVSLNNPISNSFQKSLSFEGRRQMVKSVCDAAEKRLETKVSLKNKKYVIMASNNIEEMWGKIRRKEVALDFPKFSTKPKGKPAGVLKPVYGNLGSEMLLEVSDGKITERVYLDRKSKKDFRYEKIMDTDYGSATLKYHNSQAGDDPKIASRVNELIHTYIRKMFMPNPLKDYFSMKFNFVQVQ